MLRAVLDGKKRGTGLAGKQLQLGDTDGAEDVLTATVFERLAYLPDSLLTRFLNKLLRLDDSKSVGAIGDDGLQFWPMWSLPDKQHVEPDVVLYGSNRTTLLVEAKRYDNSQQQYASQLARELVGGLRDDGIQRPVVLTIGGLQDYTEKTCQELRQQINEELKNIGTDREGSLEYDLVCRSWRQIYATLKDVVNEADADWKPGLQRLLMDIAAAYEWHGLRTHDPRWLVDLKPLGITFPDQNLEFLTMTAIDKTAIEGALLNVRNAYRLLADYQQRVLELLGFIRETLGARHYHYHYWKTVPRNHLEGLGRGDNDGQRFLLFNDLSFLWLRPRTHDQKDPVHFHRKGDLLIDVSVRSDTGDGAENEREMDAEDSVSELRIYFFLCVEPKEESHNWYDKVWNKTGYPPLGKMVECAIPGYYAYGEALPLADLVNEESARSAITKMVEKFNEQVKEWRLDDDCKLVLNHAAPSA